MTPFRGDAVMSVGATRSRVDDCKGATLTGW